MKIIHVMDRFYSRKLIKSLSDALKDSPVVLLNGARQTGKTTLVLEQLADKNSASYISLDDAAMLSSARSDATGFLEGLVALHQDNQAPLVIDEVQHAPELFPAIKLLVDKERQAKRQVAGKFLLTGSANVLLLPKISESLAGRMEVLTLWPLSQSEIEGTEGNLVDALFASPFAPALSTGDAGKSTSLHQRLQIGGYPEALQRGSDARRKAWFDSYVTAILQRDVRDLSNIEGLTEMPRLLQLLATRAGGILNLADISRSIALPYATLHRYMSLLETTFLIYLLPAWSHRLGNRLVKASKLMLCDTGLATALLGVNEARLQNESLLRGALSENFVVMEMRKLAGWSHTAPQMFHFRTQNGQEVDLVLENAGGQIVGVETKSAASVTESDFNGLRHLAEIAGKHFVRGIVLYSGDKIVPFAKNLFAVPLRSLWS